MMAKNSNNTIADAIRSALKELTPFFDELEGESDRAAAILACSCVENACGNILRSQFPHDIDDKVWKGIFGPGAPISDLTNKAKMIEAFGCFGLKTRRTIETIGTIRNKFAHDPGIRSFGHHSVREHCRSLGDNPVHPYKLKKNTLPEDVRANYISTARHLQQRLDRISYHEPDLDDPPLEPLP